MSKSLSVKDNASLSENRFEPGHQNEVTKHIMLRKLEVIRENFRTLFIIRYQTSSTILCDFILNLYLK